jgi:ankyrin repeat protein
MDGICNAASRGDLDEVKHWVKHDPSLLNGKEGYCGMTALMWASAKGQVGVARWPSSMRRITVGEPPCSPIVVLLMETGADASITRVEGKTPLMAAFDQAHFNVLRLLLNDPNVMVFINHRDEKEGRTVLWDACCHGLDEVVRALLLSGADFTIADKKGRTPMAITHEQWHLSLYGFAEKGRHRECVAALEVRC